MSFAIRAPHPFASRVPTTIVTSVLDYSAVKELLSNEPLRRPNRTRPFEVYSPERKAEFLLSSAVNAADYEAAVRETRAMGLDPDRIPHHRPLGA